MSKNINNNGFDYVDLGLPSGTLWATMNVGASNPTDYGLYFQWGDTQGYAKDQVGKDKQFNWDEYKWNPSREREAIAKYELIGTTLDLEDDAAHVHMGGGWHMPSPDQIRELIDNTTSEWTKQNGVIGSLFTSNKDASKSVFIPAAGFACNGSISNSGYDGNVWGSMLSSYYVSYGQSLHFSLGNAHIDSYANYYGHSVRGVIG